MFQPDGFALGKCLVANRRNQVYSAVRESDGREVVLKTITAPRSQDAAELRREYEALLALAGPGTAEALEWLDGERPVLVMALAAGQSITAWLRGGPPSLHAFLEMTIQLTETLARIHGARFLHCDVSPENVLVDPTTLCPCLIDFGRARPLGAQTHASEGVGLSGLLSYMAPEQTGRMNRGVDSRSDLYALGATLYFALTGVPPFAESDPLALIHAHMARVPRAPVELQPDLPVALSRIVLKLLEKEPEDRYQSARGLLADLRTCRELLTRFGRIDPELPLGTAEAPDRPRFSTRLFGRETEIELLRTLFARAQAGTAQVLMLAGEPGAGKSALIDELRPQVAQSSGYLVVGKFDLSRDRPYAAWAAALGALAQQLLVESDARLAHWRELLRGALGNIAQVLVDLVPDLAFVLQDVPPVPRLGPRETQTRLALALQRFIRACATPEHPLILFLDDLQWSDGASRDLLEDLVCNGVGVALLVVGAYRANEVSLEHPLMRSLERFAAQEVPLERIALRPLSIEATVEMLADCLARRPEDVGDLADLVRRTTGSAPLFVRQFIDHLHDLGLLRYADGVGWTWDMAAVAGADIHESAVGLMTAKLQRLDAEARAAIELASCVSDEFDVELLQQLSGREREPLERGLYALSDAGLLGPCARGFRFMHDRIREAARQLLSEPEQARLHHDMAQLMLTRHAGDELMAHVVEIADHLNRGLSCLDESRQLEAMRLNAWAAISALAVGAASTAEGFLTAGRGLLREEHWNEDPTIAFDLLFRSAESAFLRRDFAAALSLADELERRPLTPMQRAQVAARRIQILALTRNPEDCARHGLEALRPYGIRWPLYPSRLRAYVALRIVQWRARGARIEAALTLTSNFDPAFIAPLVILAAGGATMARVSQYLGALAVAYCLSNNLRRGYIAGPSYALGSFAQYLQGVVGDTADAERIERVALAWQERTPDPIFAPKNDVGIHALLRPWRMPRRKALAPLERVAETLHEVGDLEYCQYARFLKALFSALAGDRVGKSARGLEEQADADARMGQKYTEPILCYRAYRHLEASNPGAVEAELTASESEIAQRPTAEPYVRTLWMLVLAVEGRWDLVLEQSERMGDRLSRVVPLVHVADHTFYRGLAAAALAGKARGAARRRQRRIVDASLRRLEHWGRVGPDFVHMALLLAAERARLGRNGKRARSLYERAAQRARQQEFPHHAALALERLGRMLIELRRRAEAAAALNQALTLYRDWGATAKAAALTAELAALSTH